MVDIKAASVQQAEMFAGMVNRATIALDNSAGYQRAVMVQIEEWRWRPPGEAYGRQVAVDLFADHSHRKHLLTVNAGLIIRGAPVKVPSRLLKMLMNRVTEGIDE